jgi:GT2 family glycosyltransferase
MNKALDLSIVVLNWNTSDLLPKALTSIIESTKNTSYDVTVIDNASTDGGLERIDEKIKNDTRFRFVQMKKNVGWIAINEMLKGTEGKYIVTVDPDAILHEGALDQLHDFMETHPEAGAVTANLFNPDGSLQLYYRRIMTPKLFFYTTLIGRFFDKYFLSLKYWKWYRYEDLDTTEVCEVEQPAWPCLMWRRESLGPYIVDPELPFYFLDVEMSKRVYNNKYKIYLVPAARATHLKSTSYGKRESSWRRNEYYRSLILYFKKHYPKSLFFIWVLERIDRTLRGLLRTITGREPLR